MHDNIESRPVSRPVELDGLTVSQLQAALVAGTFSAEELTAACLDQIATYDRYYNAIVFLNPSALDEARQIDARRRGGEALGPLAGVPIVVKDTMDMKGFPTTAGLATLYSGKGGVDLMPLKDCAVVARIRAAGAVVLGKTNVPILSHKIANANNSWAGATLNPVVPDRAPGGSSTGTATAVAARMAVLGLAEETAGSVQNPASAQGLVAIKPTFALVPNTGILPLSSNRDTAGPIARCVRDAALCLDAIAGFSMEDLKTTAAVGHRPKEGYCSRLTRDALKGARIGLYGPGWRDQPLAEETAALYARAQAEIETLGATLVADPFAGSAFASLRETTQGGIIDARGIESVPYDIENYLRRFGPEAPLKDFTTFHEAIGHMFSAGQKLGYLNNLPGFTACLEAPSEVPDMSCFMAAREAYLRIFDEVFDAHRLDALVFPQMCEEIPSLRERATIHATTVSEINIAGLPGVVVPAGAFRSGAPFCLIVVGRRWQEAELLGFAYAYEQATRHYRAPPLTNRAP